MQKYFNIIITGVVQGVNFRGASKPVAATLGVTGFIRNEPNGDVYAEVEGEEEKVQEFVQWCYHGPERAEVKEVVVKEGEIKNFMMFEVKGRI